MFALASILFAYASVAAVVAGRLQSARIPRTGRLAPRRNGRTIFYSVAVLALIAALAFWPAHDGWLLTTICVSFALSASAAFIILLEPLAPRLVWRLAVAAPPLALAASFLR
jgi:hypothetical protein